MITFMDTTEGISPDSLRGFFVGWPNPPSPAAILPSCVAVTASSSPSKLSGSSALSRP
jgi:hypothetical protein